MLHKPLIIRGDCSLDPESDFMECAKSRSTLSGRKFLQILFPISSQLCRLFFLALLLTGIASTAHAQIKVGISMKRSLFVVYEPILATITVTNLSGRDLVLRDSGVHHWFGFNIVTAQGRIIPPINPNYALAPLELGAGETVRRTVNLTPLYGIREPGLYRIKPLIYSENYEKYFSSQVVNVQIVEAQLIWHQTIGVPEGMEGSGELRTVKLLTHRGTKDKTLYVQMENSDEGIVYAIYRLGRLVQSQDPEVEIGTDNSIHVLQLAAPRTYLYSVVAANGDLLGQKRYVATRRPPHLRRLEDGSVGIVGGMEDIPSRLPEGLTAPPKLSDRPPGLP